MFGLIISVTVTVIVLLVMGFIFLPVVKNMQAGKRILQTGVPAQAMIEQLGETGITVNNQPMVEFGLRVRHADGREYGVTHRQILPRLMMGMVTIGVVVPVKVDVAQPEKVVIDWSAVRPAHSPVWPKD
ncbi:hypothetical protein [Nonomuraea typhae]|uniref:hypothetical protein n=1 Tax=Nonomuraea typhae TaxID=2603600 RepID=UPI0012F995DD|nr:hypothetical protein [Nonomuraea typhae]